MGGMFGNMRLPKVKSPYDVGGIGEYGIKKFDPAKTMKAQDELFTRDITEGMNFSNENAIAGGSFNPELSAYNSTQSARNSRNRASADLDKYAYETQFKELDALLGISSDKRQNEALNFEKERWNEEKPTWLTDVFTIAGGVLPFLSKGTGRIGDAKFKAVMQEFQNGTLKDDSGQPVTDFEQALDMAYQLLILFLSAAS